MVTMPEDSDSMQIELAHIIKKFPEYELKITHLYACDEDFKTLCDDYWYCSCFVAQSKLKKPSRPDLQVEEYACVCVALEEEASAYLRRH